MTENPRWKHRPPGSNWGDFGPDDQNGRLNLITPDKVRQAVAEVKEGLTFCLSLPLDLPGGNVLNPRHSDVISDDLVLMHLQYSTQWDSFAHVGQLFDADGDGVPEPRYYNGYRPQVDIFGPQEGADAGVPPPGGRWQSTSRAKALGIERMAERSVQGRGVMIDLRAHCGPGRTVVGHEQLMAILAADGITVESGDMVCLHTGFAQALIDMGGQPDGQRLAQTGAVLDGRDARLLQWITDSGLSVLIADNYAVEAHPATSEPEGCCATLPLHEHCLFKQGIHLGEIWHLTPLAEWLRAHGRHRFLLTAPPLRLPGAVGSPVTPVATV